MSLLTYWISLVIGSGLYCWTTSKPIEEWLVGPYWAAVTLLGVHFLGIKS